MKNPEHSPEPKYLNEEEAQESFEKFKAYRRAFQENLEKGTPIPEEFADPLGVKVSEKLEEAKLKEQVERRKDHTLKIIERNNERPDVLSRMQESLRRSGDHE